MASISVKDSGGWKKFMNIRLLRSGIESSPGPNSVGMEVKKRHLHWSRELADWVFEHCELVSEDKEFHRLVITLNKLLVRGAKPIVCFLAVTCMW